MRLLLDASAIVKLVLEEPGSEETRQAVRDAVTAGGTLHTTDYAAAESLNAVWKQAHLGRRTANQSREAASDLDTVLRGLTPTPTALHAHEALELSFTHHTPVYDTLYIAAAHSLDATLLTADGYQWKTATAENVKTSLIPQIQPN